MLRPYTIRVNGLNICVKKAEDTSSNHTDQMHSDSCCQSYRHSDTQHTMILYSKVLPDEHNIVSIVLQYSQCYQIYEIYVMALHIARQLGFECCLKGRQTRPQIRGTESNEQTFLMNKIFNFPVPTTYFPKFRARVRSHNAFTVFLSISFPEFCHRAFPKDSSD